MHTSNGDLDKLCGELQSMILDELSLPDLIVFGKTRKENQEGVKDYMEKRRKSLFSTFIKDVDGFTDMMEETGTIIGGSSALQLFQAKSEAFVLWDMDVYVTKDFEEEVIDHLKEDEDYKVTRTVMRKRNYDSSSIIKVNKLARGNQMIDVIVTDWASAIVPILQYHSTAVMNYITARTFTSLYPKWTRDKKSLVNPAVYLDDKSDVSTALALMKYVGRGFNVSAEPFELGAHNCHRSAYCPGTTRNTIDDDTLRWQFTPRKTIGKTMIACEEMAIIVWCLGGQDCEEGDGMCQAYIAVTA